MDTATQLKSARKRRGIVKASVTRLEDRIQIFELRREFSNADKLAIQRLLTKLEEQDAEFKKHHYIIVELLEEEDELEEEQAKLDDHDDKIADFISRLQVLAGKKVNEPVEETVTTTPPLGRQLDRIKRKIAGVQESVDAAQLEPNVDRCLLQQLEEQVTSLKRDLSNVGEKIASLDEDRPDLSDTEDALDKVLFKLSLQIKRLLNDTPSNAPSTSNASGVKLPRIDVPTFDGNIVNWVVFWEQFEAAIHSKRQLSNADKLTYLRHALKNGTARQVIEGLSQAGDNYPEAIDCLRRRYDRPRLIHRAHVQSILNAPPLKTGNGKELRRIHDTVNQHLRALRAMDYDPSGPFITSVLELKLNEDILFKWQRHSMESGKVPHYQDMLDFLDLRAQSTESIEYKVDRRGNPSQHRASYVASTDNTCVACKKGNHPLYTCQAFKLLPHEKKESILRGNGYCFNCLNKGHISKHCPSSQRCRKCLSPHHTWMHSEPESDTPKTTKESSKPVTSHTSRLISPQQQVLLMTCQLRVVAANGQITNARALLDSASSTSFITERLAQHLRLPRVRRSLQISGIGGIDTHLTSRGIVRFNVTNLSHETDQLPVEAVVLPKITTELPVRHIPNDGKWKHLKGLHLADPDFNVPGSVDLLLGADLFGNIVRHGRRVGPPGTPSAIQTAFGWVLSGSINLEQPSLEHVTTCCTSLLHGDDLMKKFWEVEERVAHQPALSIEEKTVQQHFDTAHTKDENGTFIVPLPRRENVEPLGDSRALAVKRFLSLERSLKVNDKSHDFAEAVWEYFDMGHAEPVPTCDLVAKKESYYMPMHVVMKESRTTTKMRVVFDASAKSTSGTSLNEHLLVGPTVHPSLIDVLLRFRRHKIALTTDVSRMYRAVLLPNDQRDLHRFVWRRESTEPLVDYRMTRLTFGVSASSFAANMAVKQNALDNAQTYPQAAQSVLESFYVDDGLTGADSVEEAVHLQKQLHVLFSGAGFILRKWKANEPDALAHVAPELKDQQPSEEIRGEETYTKVLGLEWDADLDAFHPTVTKCASLMKGTTKRMLLSNIARVYDVLGWCSPSVIKLKILMQRLWEEKLGWDDDVPPNILEIWEKWRKELPLLHNHLIPRCYYPRHTEVKSVQLHGFCDASESAYAAVAYLRIVDIEDSVTTSLVIAKTKVAPIKRLSIPRLELCGAVLLARLISYVGNILQIPTENIYAWTDSSVVLSWLRGNPRRFKTFVGNRVSEVIELIPPNCWQHVKGADNPADSASRGIFPSELIKNDLWWEGPQWLRLSESRWPDQPPLLDKPEPHEERDEEPNLALTTVEEPSILDRFSNYTRLKRVTAWMFRFVHNCGRNTSERNLNDALTTEELQSAEWCWIRIVQHEEFEDVVMTLKAGKLLPRSSKLLAFHPLLDGNGILRLGGRIDQAKLPFSKRHPIILPGSHRFTKLLIESEHVRLLHAGPTLVAASLARNYYIVKGRRVIRSITRSCVTCKRARSDPKPQILGQLPPDRLTPGPVFDRVGVDYAGPILTKSGPVRKPSILKSYVAVFVCFATKAVHLELVSDLTTASFMATLRRFMARRGKPSIIWSDHGTNFVGAARELGELRAFLQRKDKQNDFSDFCAAFNIKWKFTPEHAPHFGGLWEAAVKSFKKHLKVVVGGTKLTFEEMTTVLTQIEACLNSRPLTPLPEASDGIEVLTPGHFLIGRPLEALPQKPGTSQSTSLVRRWYLCQAIVQHVWQRWSDEYLCQLQTFAKWNTPSPNLKVGDIVCLRGEQVAPTQWILARVKEVHPGPDGKVRVVTVQTTKGTYRRPIVKVVPLITSEEPL